LNKYLMGSHFSVHWMAGFVSGIIGFWHFQETEREKMGLLEYLWWIQGDDGQKPTFSWRVGIPLKCQPLLFIAIGWQSFCPERWSQKCAANYLRWGWGSEWLCYSSLRFLPESKLFMWAMTNSNVQGTGRGPRSWMSEPAYQLWILREQGCFHRISVRFSNNLPSTRRQIVGVDDLIF
jgi:hypothetical protein